MSEMVQEIVEPIKAKGLPRSLMILIGIALIILLLAVSFGIVVWALTRKLPAVSTPSVGDLIALLFAASSLALVIFSFLIAFLAIVGWQTLKNDVQKDIEGSVSLRIISLEKQLHGRVLAAFGVIQGRFYLQALPQAKSESEKIELADTLAEVVDHCWQSYAILRTIEGNSKFMALNNFLYFASMQGAQARSEFILGQARELMTVAAEKSYWEGLLSCYRVILVFSEDPAEIERVAKRAADLGRDKQLSDRQKREALSLVPPLTRRLEELKRQIS